jgi:hypothetical protein
MCKKDKAYKRLKSLAKYCNSRVFETSLGPRLVSIKNNKIEGKVRITYNDYDGSMLFTLAITRNGDTEKVSRIDDLAMFAAIMEIEGIVANEAQLPYNRVDVPSISALFRWWY